MSVFSGPNVPRNGITYYVNATRPGSVIGNTLLFVYGDNSIDITNGSVQDNFLAPTGLSLLRTSSAISASTTFSIAVSMFSNGSTGTLLDARNGDDLYNGTTLLTSSAPGKSIGGSATGNTNVEYSASAIIGNVVSDLTTVVNSVNSDYYQYNVSTQISTVKSGANVVIQSNVAAGNLYATTNQITTSKQPGNSAVNGISSALDLPGSLIQFYIDPNSLTLRLRADKTDSFISCPVSFSSNDVIIATFNLGNVGLYFNGTGIGSTNSNAAIASTVSYFAGSNYSSYSSAKLKSSALYSKVLNQNEVINTTEALTARG